MAKAPYKVAIVHDWLVGGGAELVVEQLHQMFPEAPIYTSYCTEEWRQRLDGKVRTGFLQHFGTLRKYLPFVRIWWFSRLRLKGYDVVISSSGAEAKGIRVPSGTVHINYCHAPTHYYWSRYDEYLEHPGFGPFDWLARLGLRLLVGPLRRWDYKAAQRPDIMVANSTHTQAAIKQYYDRASVVVHPPVAVNRFRPADAKAPRAGFLIAGRQTPYKRFDLAISACSTLGLPLRVIGDGPDNARLHSLAGPSIQFLGKVSDAELAKAFAEAAAFLFPGIDDFGITPVEAMAAGAPVIAYRAGGALDYVTSGKTGEFFPEPTADSLGAVLANFKPQNYSSSDIMEVADQFRPAVFIQKMQQIIDKSLT